MVRNVVYHVMALRFIASVREDSREKLVKVGIANESRKNFNTKVTSIGIASIIKRVFCSNFCDHIRNFAKVIYA